MKKLLLPIFCLALLAAPAFAQDAGPSEDLADPQAHDGSGGFEDTRHGRGGRNRNNDRPVAPVPEPGTMALASMGLIALGAAARRRRK